MPLIIKLEERFKHLDKISNAKVIGNSNTERKKILCVIKIP